MSTAQTPFSSLLLEGLDHYRKGKMLEAVHAWEQAYLLEPTNLRAREFLRSALERIHAHPDGPPAAAVPPEAAPAGTAAPRPAGISGHPWLPEGPAALRSPWDEGPSLALPDESRAAADLGDPWNLHEEAAAMAPPADDGQEVAIWLRGARELLGLNDFSGALDLAAKVLERRPADEEAVSIRALCEENLTQMYESKIGLMGRRPRVALQPDEVIWLNLDSRAGFVLAQIDGQVSFEELYAICGLSRLDTARILCELLAEGVIVV